jgi:tetraacyldisaccharide 4'-kinase
MNLDRLFNRITAPQTDPLLLPLSLGLLPASLIYAGAQRVRQALYRRGWLPVRKLNRPVISVGNLTLGGTGKTPLVIRIVELLRNQGRRPAVLSRGYRGDADAPVNVVCDGSGILLGPEAAGDEPVLIAQRFGAAVPVLTGPDRFLTGQYAIEQLGADVLILDDGFQHSSLHRDCNILMLDGQEPFGNGRVFPAGPLREPLSAIARADLICLTNNSSGPVCSALLPWIENRPMVTVGFQPTAVLRLDGKESSEPDSLRGRRILAFCGIARPQRFRATLEGLGARVTAFREFPDHHRWSDAELERLQHETRTTGAECLVVTEKDAVKLATRAFGLPVFVLRLGLKFHAGERNLTEMCLGVWQTPPAR